jgi:hypothetical protein
MYLTCDESKIYSYKHANALAKKRGKEVMQYVLSGRSRRTGVT